VNGGGVGTARAPRASSEPSVRFPDVSAAADFRTRVRRALLDRRVAGGHWEGHLSSSALATATAVTALAVAARDGRGQAGDGTLVERGVEWLVEHVNGDGGWGDTPDSVSNISTTALAWAALSFGRGDDVMRAAAGTERWIARAAGGEGPHRLAAALADRYGKDRTFSVPILTMCAASGRLGNGPAAWSLVPQLPFELAIFPRRLFGALRLPVVSYALPALISMGLARHRCGPRPALLGAVRDHARARVLHVLNGLQPRGGGFLEAIPLTSFVVMSLVAAGETDHPVVSRGLGFLRRSVRADGSWAIDSNLATWVTTLAVNALAAGEVRDDLPDGDRRQIVAWLLAQQGRRVHPYTGAAPGGWAWTDLPGGVPDADDTAGALIALAHLGREEGEVRQAAARGVQWLLDLQNRDGGIPTFCRGWGALPFDCSASDLTAHALGAWAVWLDELDPRLRRRTAHAIERAIGFLTTSQRADGAFVPLWFGNQAEPSEANPVFGTARVLKGLAAVNSRHAREVQPIAARAAAWLADAQNSDGGWGGGPRVPASIEETAAAVTGLCIGAPVHLAAIERGLAWLTAATDEGRVFRASPIGLYFARLWYAEALYPVIFVAEALGSAEALSSSPAGIRPPH
jgi:squalene-hopene/tetraprenyl-beta-curcumene cyclase